jgi:hypothetical protein
MDAVSPMRYTPGNSILDIVRNEVNNTYQLPDHISAQPPPTPPKTEDLNESQRLERERLEFEEMRR